MLILHHINMHEDTQRDRLKQKLPESLLVQEDPEKSTRQN